MQHKSLLLSVSKKVIGVKIELCGNAQHKYASQSIGCGHYTTVHTIMQEEIAENNSKTQGYPIEERAEIGIYRSLSAAGANLPPRGKVDSNLRKSAQI